MRIGRIGELIRRHEWFAVGIDLFVVVLGILLALQLDALAGQREERRLEASYLERLAEDLGIERRRMDAAESYARSRIEAARFLDSLALDPELAEADPTRVPWAIETATWRSFPQINAFVYRELQSTGRLALIESEPVRRGLAEHYTALQHDARVGEDLAAQGRFDAAVAGILSIDELAALEMAAGEPTGLVITPERATEMARAFARRPAARAEIGNLVQHHTFNLRVVAQMRQRADSLVGQIRRLQARDPGGG